MILTICLHTDKWFRVLLSNTNNSIPYWSFACTHSSLWRAASTDFPDPLSSFVSIVHPAALLDYILCSHRAVVDKFLLVVQYLLVHVKGSIGERRLWVRLYFSSSCMSDRWLYRSCFVGCCLQDLLNTASSILV